MSKIFDPSTLSGKISAIKEIMVLSYGEDKEFSCSVNLEGESLVYKFGGHGIGNNQACYSDPDELSRVILNDCIRFTGFNYVKII